jgi:PhzF family phenazine biosynthesis protein
MPISLPLVQVDAFTNRPFAGNPAAVCVTDEALDTGLMQHIAAEMNLSETAFVQPRGEEFSLRWFTPATEVDLCGHATLAAAHVLWEEGHWVAERPARFHTRSGLLTAARRGDWIEMNFPATPAAPADAPAGLAEALGASPVFVGRSRFDVLVELAGEAELRGLSPDFRKLNAVAARGIIVTSKSNSAEFDFVSRFFAPAVGVDEDPVTGSAHCCLTPFWAERLGKTELKAYQASARGGVLKLKHDGDRVLLAGQAVTVLRGTMLV